MLTTLDGKACESTPERHMGGTPKIGKNTPKWTVKIMENPIKMDDLGGKPTIFRNPHMSFSTSWFSVFGTSKNPMTESD